jgi:uncharacterized membrane protein
MILNKRSLILHWIERGAIPQQRVDSALEIGAVLPTLQSWRKFLDWLLLFSGVVALACAVIFFFAYNWDAMGRFAKFGLVEVFIVLSLAGYWKFGAERMAGKAILLMASLLLGALLALYGQTYQTGVDPWQLFAYWALLILPWVVIARFAALWLVWIVLLNVALLLYLSVFRGLWGLLFSLDELLYFFLALNTAALVVWELGAMRFSWLAERWAPRLLAFAGGAMATILMLQLIFDWDDNSDWISLIYPLWLVAIYYIYRHRITDLFMLAAGCLSLIVIVTSLLLRAMIDSLDVSAGGLLLIALVIIGMSAGAALWLKQVRVEMES